MLIEKLADAEPVGEHAAHADRLSGLASALLRRISGETRNNSTTLNGVQARINSMRLNGVQIDRIAIWFSVAPA